MSGCETDILFADFVKLLNSISHVRVDHSRSSSPSSRLDLVKKWILMLKQYYPSIPASTCKIFFRLFFPEEDVRRRYNIQETTLAKSLVQIFSLPVNEEGAGKRLMAWSDVERRTNVGCLGIEVERVLLLRHSGSTSLTFREIDRLLDDLASLSGYSHSDIRKKRDPSLRRMSILKDIFANMSPVEAKFMTQIILKDLRPVLYPVQEINTTRALLHHKSNEIHVLTKWEVMRAWHPSMPSIYRSRATLDAVCDALEDLGSQLITNICSPVLGIPIEIPKSQKGRSLSHALQFFKGQQEIWAETKYDGERMQIHIDLSKSYDQQIAVFSKSKRDSTLDRRGTHSIIRAALNLPLNDDKSYPLLLSRMKSGSHQFKHTLILDAEMVAYSERKGAIDEFWRIRSLIESTGSGIRSARYYTKKGAEPLIPCESQSTQTSGVNSDLDNIEDSLVSNASDCSDRHLKVVFFDIMLIDGRSLLEEDYQSRRAQLERLVSPILGFASLSQRERINLNHNAVPSVARIFAENIADYQEGIVLKGATSTYNDRGQPWVKLKRDYIPGYGDTVDLVLIGASWSKSRARELRVAPQTLTTFFVAASKASSTKVERPDFQILFVVEYGMSREELETLNFYIKHAGYYTYPINQVERLSYNFSLPSVLPAKPAVMFIQPLLGEFYGAGFTKDSGTLHYSLRFPRLTKIWRPAERPWTEGINLEEFQRLARSAIGHESRDDWANRSIESIWGTHTGLAPRDRSVIEIRFEEWYEKLLKLENLHYCLGTRRDFRNQHNELKRKREMENSLSKRIKYQDQKNQFNMEASFAAAAAALSMPHTPVEEYNSGGLVATMKKMIPMSPGSRTTCNDQVVVVDISQMLAVKPLNDAHTKKYRDRGSEFSDSNNSFLEIEASEKVSCDGSERDKHTNRYHWKASPIITFIQDAYVWIPKDPQGKRPATRPPAFKIISHDKRIGVIYFLLIICGCRVEVDGVVFKANDEQFEQAKKCVIFVDTGDEPDKREALQWLMDALESWRHELNKKTSKQLFVFDSNLLSYAVMSSPSAQDNIQAAALWRSR